VQALKEKRVEDDRARTGDLLNHNQNY